jgi:hypothetical protein
MAYYITRRASNASAVNVEVQVNTDADGNTPGLLVPFGISSIKQIISAIGASITAVAGAGSAQVLRLKGAALIQGQQDLTIGFVREDTTSTGGTHLYQPQIMNTDIPVTPGQSLSMATLQGGVDPGTPEVEVTLVFA